MLINFPPLKSGEGGLFASGLASRGFTVGLICKTTTFMYISLPSVHDYDVKMTNITFYRGLKQATTKYSLSF